MYVIRNIIVALAKSTALFLRTAGRPASLLPAPCRKASSPLSAPCREASQLLSCALMGGQQASLIQVRATVKSVAINPRKKPCE